MLATLEFLATAMSPSLASNAQIIGKSLCDSSLGNRSGRKNSIEVFNSRAENAEMYETRGSYLNAILEIDGGRVQLIRLDQTSPQQLVGLQLLRRTEYTLLIAARRQVATY